jgi:hypothetical protein
VTATTGNFWSPAQNCGQALFVKKPRKWLTALFENGIKPAMFMHLRQLKIDTNKAGLKAVLAVRDVELNAISALLLGLAIILTLSGVAQIA